MLVASALCLLIIIKKNSNHSANRLQFGRRRTV